MACHCDYDHSNPPGNGCLGNASLGVAQKWGTRGWECDSPPSLVFTWLNETAALFREQIDFIVWTGDTTRHNRDTKFHPVTFETVIGAIQKMTYYFAGLWNFNNQQIPIFPTLGNNDVFPHDTCLPGPNALFGNISQSWATFLDQRALQTFQIGGYYRQDINAKISMIGMNSIYMASFNTAVPDCNVTGAAKAHLDWFSSTMGDLQAAQRIAYVSGHVPPHPDRWKPACFERFVNISYFFRKAISANFFGHTHADQFWTLHHHNVQNNRAVGVVNVAPSVVPSYNPSMRVWEYDPNSGEILDFTQYFSQISQDNQQNQTPHLVQEYQMKHVYQMKDLSLKSYEDLLARIQSNSSVAQLYELYETVSAASSLALPYDQANALLHSQNPNFVSFFY